jgi:hypothetical protein
MGRKFAVVEALVLAMALTASKPRSLRGNRFAAAKVHSNNIKGQIARSAVISKCALQQLHSV